MKLLATPTERWQSIPDIVRPTPRHRLSDFEALREHIDEHGSVDVSASSEGNGQALTLLGVYAVSSHSHTYLCAVAKLSCPLFASREENTETQERSVRNDLYTAVSTGRADGRALMACWRPEKHIFKSNEHFSRMHTRPQCETRCEALPPLRAPNARCSPPLRKKTAPSSSSARATSRT